MNGKRFFLSFIVIFVLLEIFSYLIHSVILSSTYMSEGSKQLFRPEEQMNSYMWVIWVTDLIWSLLFVFFFVKGYENKGIMEGLRYGFYMGVFYSFVQAYQQFAVYPIPYSLALQWFIYGLIEMLILGFAAALLYKPKKVAVTEPSAA
jgi:hypothetical protein